MNQDQLTFFAEGHLVSHSASPDSEKDCQTSEGILRSHIAEWLISCAPSGSFGKTSPVSCHQMEDGTLVPSSGRWQNSGMYSDGVCLTLNTSESPKDAVDSSLSDVLQEISEISDKCYLTPRAAKGILDRAEKRQKDLPEKLRDALTGLASASTRLIPNAD
jgi:hypothetical protein